MLLTTQEIRDLVTSVVEERFGRELDDADWGPFLDRVSIEFQPVLRNRCLGRCRGIIQPDGRRVMILAFSELFWPLLTDEGRRDTVIHELAHAVDFHRRGKMLHDVVWRRLATELGCVPRAIAPAAQSTPALTELLMRARRGYRCFNCAACGELMRLTPRTRRWVAAGIRLQCPAMACKATLPENIFDLSYIRKRE